MRWRQPLDFHRYFIHVLSRLWQDVHVPLDVAVSDLDHFAPLTNSRVHGQVMLRDHHSVLHSYILPDGWQLMQVLIPSSLFERLIRLPSCCIHSLVT